MAGPVKRASLRRADPAQQYIAGEALQRVRTRPVMGASLRPALVQLTVNTSPPSDFRTPLASFAAIRNSACPPAHPYNVQ